MSSLLCLWFDLWIGQFSLKNSHPDSIVIRISKSPKVVRQSQLLGFGGRSADEDEGVQRVGVRGVEIGFLFGTGYDSVTTGSVRVGCPNIDLTQSNGTGSWTPVGSGDVTKGKTVDRGRSKVRTGGPEGEQTVCVVWVRVKS